MSLSVDDTRPVALYRDGNPLRPLYKEEAYNRQVLFGKNVIESHSTRAWYTILFNSIFDPFNMLLIGIAALSFYLQDLKTFVIMVVMVSVSSGIRFYHETKNESKLSALTKMIKKNITVIRRNKDDIEFDEVIDLRDCVPGDFVKLKAGDLVPAEVQLLKTNNLTVDQSALTGESMPCLKYVTELNIIHIDYDLNAADSLNLRKSKFLLEPLKNFFFSCLRNNLGIDLNHQENRFEFDSRVLTQFDRNDLCFMGTNVISGNAIGIVLAIGKQTFFGVMNEKISLQRPISAFNKRIKRVSLLFIILMFLITIPIILFKGFDIFKQQPDDEEEAKKQGRWLLALQFALSVAVGLTPEMLPALVNTILARGTIQLSNKNCIVKRIESIINLGNMDVLCTDKTGTLTENFAKVANVFDHKRENCSLGLELAYLNSAYQESFQNLTDQAIINAYEENAKPVSDFESSRLIKVAEMGFDFKRRKMSLVYEVPEQNIRLITSKGAVKEMLEVCTHYMDQLEGNNNNILTMEDLFRVLKSTINKSTSDQNGKLVEQVDGPDDFRFDYSIKELKKSVLNGLNEFNDQLNHEGYRVLAVAYQVESMYVERDQSSLREKNLIFVGFLALVNPPKETVRQAIRELNSKKVSVKILTGDVVEVCRNVCNQIGLPTDHVLTSSQMSRLTSSQLENLVDKTVIFSQMSPIQKLEIVNLLKARGHVVGFLGDGINDALALKEADVGISVDSGTEIAKEAADIILLEKSLSAIAEGVVQGRRSFINIVKYIAMVLSSNFGNVISVFIASLTLPYLPMLPFQLILQNLLYDLSQTTMPFDNVDEEDIQRPQVFKLKNLIIFMLFFGPISSIFDVLTFGYFYFYYGIKTADDERVLLFQTGWFTVGLMTQTLITHIARTHKVPVFQSNANTKVYISTAICLYLGLIAPFLPLGAIYKMAKLPVDFYYFLLSVLAAYCVTVQLGKTVYLAIFKSWFVSYKKD